MPHFSSFSELRIQITIPPSIQKGQDLERQFLGGFLMIFLFINLIKSNIMLQVPFVRSDHSRFWVVNETDYTSFPAILLTDTGPSRGQMIDCYHKACDSVRSPYDGKFANMDFYQQIVQTLLNSVLEMSKSQCLRTEDLTGFYSEIEEQNNETSSASKGQFFGNSLISLTEFIRRYMPW